MDTTTKSEAVRLQKKIRLDTGLNPVIEFGYVEGRATFKIESNFDWNLRAINDEFFEGCGTVEKVIKGNYLLTANIRLVY